MQMMKSKADEEDYWNSSKFKAFTFDDEDDEFSRVRPEDSNQVQVQVLSLVLIQVFIGTDLSAVATVMSSGVLC